MRQRNIPVTEKVSVQAQTEIKLIHEPVYYVTDDLLNTSRVYSLRQSHLLGPEGLIRPETERLLLSQFRTEIELFQGLNSLEGIPQAELKKRLQWLETQIEGLEKRSLTLLGADGNASGYYNVISDLQGKLDRQTVITANIEPRLQKLNERIAELEAELSKLRKALLKQHEIAAENQTLKDTLKQVNEVARDPKKMRDFERTVNTILVPALDAAELKLQSVLKATAVVGRAATTPQNRLKTQVNGLVKSLDRLLKTHDDFTVGNVEGVVGAFLKDLDAQHTYDEYSQGKLYKHLYQDLKEKFSAAGSVYRSTFQIAIKEHPDLKGKISMSAMQALQKGTVDAFTSGNVVVLQPSLSSGRTVYYQTLETRTKHLLSLMGRQLKHLLAKYPAIKGELGTQLLEFLSLEVFDEAIALEELERIVEVVKYQPQVVKVENVYQYDSDKNMKAIFHLRIMVKTLLEELLKVKDRTGAVLEIDEGLLGMIKNEIADLVDTEDVLRVFRSVPKILEIERIVQKDLGRYLGVLTQAHPLNVESVKVVDRVIQRPVTIKDQVGLVVEKGIIQPVVHEKPVFMAEERIVEVPVEKEVIVQRCITNQKAVEVSVTQEVPIKEVQYQEVQKVVFKERVVEVPKEVQTQVPFQTTKIVKEIVEIPRYQQRLVQVLRDITNIKEVRLTEQVPVETVKYIELEKVVNNFVKVPQLVEIKEQIPITITKTVEKPVDVIETIEKIVVSREVEERLVEVPVRHEVAVVHEVPVPYKEQTVLTVKGDKEEIIKEVERIVEKPILREVLKLREVEIEKAVPVWIREQKPVEIEVSVPYIQYEPQVVSVEVEKLVPYREEVPVEVVKEVPVPIVLEKEVLKQVRVTVEKIVEKLVEVPRVVEVEKIVEKVVVVPRVIENIVQVPQIIEKVVEREVEVLKIVEVERAVPIYLTRELKEIVQQKVPYPLEKVVYKEVDKEKIVTVKEQSEVLKEVEVERRIPVEVIVQKPVPTIVQKIIQKLLTVYCTQVHDREVILPYRQQQPVELIREKAVQLRKIIENVVQVPQVIEKQVVLYERVTEPEIHTVYVEKPVEVEKQVVYTDVRNVIEKQVEYRQLEKEVLVKEVERVEVLKPEPYIVEKVVYTNEIHEQGVEVRIEKGTAIRCDQLVEVERPVNHFCSKEVPRNIYRDKLVEVRTFVEQLKEVLVNGPEKVIQVHSIKPEVVQVTEQIVKYLAQEVEKRVYTEVPVKEQNITVVEVPAKTVVSHETQEIRTTHTQPVYAEKVVERVVLLPQILEVLKHVHDVSEIHSLAVTTDVDIDSHRNDYITVCRSLKAGLEGLLASLRSSPAKSAEAEAQISLISKLLPLISELIEFPTIVQVPKEVERIVEKQKVVVVPTKSQQAIDRELASTTLIDKLVGELKRLRSLFKVDLQLDEDVKNIFFAELKDVENLELKLQQFTRVVLDRFHALGNWTSQHSLMLNSFLQERFLMAGIIKECNDSIETLRDDLEMEEKKVDRLREVITKLNIHNITLKNALEEILQVLGRVTVEATSQPAVKSTLDNLIAKAKSSLESALSDPLRESRYLQSQSPPSKLLASEFESYRGGQPNKEEHLGSELRRLQTQNQAIRGELAKALQTPTHEKARQDRQSLDQTRRIDELSRQLQTQQQDYERKLRNTRAEFEREIQSRSRVADTREEDKLRRINKELQGRIGELEKQLVHSSNSYERLKFEMSRLNVELQSRRRELQSHVSELQQVPTTLRESARPATREQLRTPRQPPRPEQQEKKTSRGATLQSPQIRGSSKLYTPADQLKFHSPELREVRTEQEPSQIKSSSSRLSGSQQPYQPRSQPKRNLTLRQLISEGPLHENIVAIIVIKLVEKLQEETSRGRYMLYAPEAIYLTGYSSEQPDQAKVKFGEPIDPNNEDTRLYLSPEILRGQPDTEKSCIFNIGVIWDELLHGDLFFHSADQIGNFGYEYRVRNSRTNPIFKNSVFQMLSKEPKRRIGFTEIRRRLSLQQFIVLEEEGQQEIRRRL